MPNQEIPIAILNVKSPTKTPHYFEPILENEIDGINIKYVAVAGDEPLTDSTTPDYRAIYLFMRGSGTATAADAAYEIVPETILVPNVVETITIQAAPNETMHYLKITSQLTAQDQLDLQDFPADNTHNVYYAKFTDCQSYSEQIKSPNTVSRTILPNKYIPRIAMGTVQAKGPDEVGAHEHPMLEQLFLGLTDNSCIVYADDAQVDFPEYSLLHIPLGSTHSVSVEKDEVMYYVWMDFFLDASGEAWLDNHKVNA